MKRIKTSLRNCFQDNFESCFWGWGSGGCALLVLLLQLLCCLLVSGFLVGSFKNHMKSEGSLSHHKGGMCIKAEELV